MLLTKLCDFKYILTSFNKMRFATIQIYQQIFLGCLLVVHHWSASCAADFDKDKDKHNLLRNKTNTALLQIYVYTIATLLKPFLD